MKKKKQKHTFIASHDIHAGDVIFYFSVDAIQGNSNATSVEHVGICVGRDKKNIPQIAHATFGKTASHVTITPLTALYGYFVFRLSEENDPKHRLKQRMVDIASIWASQNISYDFRRRQHMIAFLNQHTTVDSAVNASKKAFSDFGHYRALKFAIRGEKPIKNGSSRGFRCDQFVILCLQVAELQLLNEDINNEYFTPLSSPNHSYDWISITNPHRDLIRESIHQGYQWMLSDNRPIKDYADQFYIDLPSRKTKHQTITTNIAPMMLLVAPYFIRALHEIYHSRVPLNAKGCSPSTLIKFLTDDDGGSGFTHIGIIVKKHLAEKFSDHENIDHDIIEKFITPSEQAIELDSEGDVFYTQTLQNILSRSQPQAHSTLSVRTNSIQTMTSYLTLLLQHHEQLNDTQLEVIVARIKRRQLSDSWQNLSSNIQTSLGQRLFRLINNITLQVEPVRKKVCARTHH